MSFVITNEELKTLHAGSPAAEVKTAIETAATSDEDGKKQELLAKFLAASKEVTTLTKTPSNDVKLTLYALYKQGLGATPTKPGMLDFVGKKKYEAWEGKKGLKVDEAQQQYIDQVEELKKAE
ncbi:hypothetical protein LPJ53_005534 [Coemansia erecta]|uniref:ACB domain-containing protein n=1 Tax=Coemansia erecta TaxID=147472 RepID=A0A9W8CN25_9FUNG|nr:hypothetical protein LPJ53_005534 [Coemansia erecta]